MVNLLIEQTIFGAIAIVVALTGFIALVLLAIVYPDESHRGQRS